MPSLRSPQVRRGSPEPGCSTLTTSAPNSPSMVATIGPATNVAVSTTRSPVSGPSWSAMGAALGTGEPERVAQCGSGVPVPEDAAALELGHHQPHDVLVGAGT